MSDHNVEQQILALVEAGDLLVSTDLLNAHDEELGKSVIQIIRLDCSFVKGVVLNKPQEGGGFYGGPVGDGEPVELDGKTYEGYLGWEPLGFAGEVIMGAWYILRLDQSPVDINPAVLELMRNIAAEEKTALLEEPPEQMYEKARTRIGA